MKVILVCFIFLLFLIVNRNEAIHRVDRLYSQPTSEASISWVFPDNIKVHILESKDKWSLVQISWDFNLIAFSNSGKVEGWLKIKE